MMQGIDPAADAQRQHPHPRRLPHREVRLHPRQPARTAWTGRPTPARSSDEHTGRGHHGRFGAGLPRVSDGSFLFLQHMLSHMKPTGSRVGIVLSGSPLFSGQAGSGESEIRRWILENDWLEGIVALPDQMFYNTGISTYVWILTNDKAPEDAGLVRLVDARAHGHQDAQVPRRQAQGAHRRPPSTRSSACSSAPAASSPTTPASRSCPARRSGSSGSPSSARCAAAGRSPPRPSPPSRSTPTRGLVGQRFETEKALLAEVTGLTPAQRKTFAKACAVADPDAPVVTGRGGKVEPDPDLRDAENVPLPAGWFDLDDDARDKALTEAAETHLETEIRPYVPDAWIDHTKTKVGVEIPFTRQFYVYEPPRPVEEIAAEIKDLETQIQTWMKDLGL